MKIISILIPPILSVITKLLTERKNKKSIFNYILTYLIMLVLSNFLVYLIVRYSFNIKNVVYSLDYYIKYICLSIFLNILIILIYKFLKYFFNLIKHDDLKLYKPKDLLTYLKRIVKYIKDLTLKHPNITFFIVTTFIFFILDFYLRLVIFIHTPFYTVLAFCPNMITILYGLLISSIIFLLPKIFSKILLILTYSLSLILFVVNYMLFIIKGQVLTIEDLTNTQEGLEYLNFITEKINIPLILIIIFSLILLIFSFKFINKIKRKFTKPKSFLLVLGSVILFIILRLFTIATLEHYSDDDWDKVNYPRYYYDEFINRNRSVISIGIYDYTIREVYMHYKNMLTTYGSIEEIEETIKKFDTENTNEYTGIFKGKNLIMIMLESIDNLEITEDIMPTLYEIKNNGWVFNKRYSKNTATIITEFSSQTGLYYNDIVYKINNANYNLSVPKLFEKAGYITSSVHDNHGQFYNREVLHKSLGFQNSYFVLDYVNDGIQFNDEQIATNDKIYTKITNKENPFMSLIVTITGHGPYNDGFCESQKINNKKECLDYKSGLTDKMLESLLNRLKEDKILDNTVLVLYSDHYPYAYDFTSEELKTNYIKADSKYELKNIPFIIYNPSIEHKEIDKLVGDIDIAPTVLNLFGIDYEPKYYVGTDVFSSAHKNLIMFSDYSWYDGNIYSLENKDNANIDYINETSNYVKTKVDLSKMIISNNYYQKFN